MACIPNLQIKQTLTYSIADTLNGYIEAQLNIEIINGYLPLNGIISIDNVNINGENESLDIVFTSTGHTENILIFYPETEPISVITNIGVKVLIDSCVYKTNCTHILTPTSQIDDVVSIECVNDVVGVNLVSGCTNPLYVEYNPNANWDDGSCQNLIPILGCTNPYAINYNPLATQNDGSCQFTSGCTNSLADNYDESAVIDDGSCLCGDIYINLDFFDNTGQTFALTGDCQYYIEFDLITKIDCQKVIEYFQNNEDKTILDIIGNLNVNFQAYSLTDEQGQLYPYSGDVIDISGTTGYINTQSENLIAFDITGNPEGIGVIGSDDACQAMLDLVAIELGLQCQTLSLNIFDVKWQKFKIAINQDLLNTFTKYVIQYQSFPFGVCSYIDNVKFISICDLSEDKCILLPQTFGFELGRIVDNKKSWVYSNETVNRIQTIVPQRYTNYTEYHSDLVWNTKNVDLRVDTSKYISNDVIEYYKIYGESFDDKNLLNITNQWIENESIDVRNRQWIRAYPYTKAVYDWYVDGKLCADSKSLDYNYGFKIISKLPQGWMSLIQQVVPMTTIWSKDEYILKNTIYDKQKHIYKSYSLGIGGTDNGGVGVCVSGDTSGITFNCETLSDECFDSFNDIDSILYSGNTSIVCTNTGQTLCTTIMDSGSFGGKLIQYIPENNGENQYNTIIALWGYETYSCISGTPFTPPPTLEAILSYCCIDNNYARVSLEIIGGLPPYTVSGNFDAEIVNIGTQLSSQITDSLGNNLLVNGDVVICSTPPCPVAGSGLPLFVYFVKQAGTPASNTGQVMLYVHTGGYIPPSISVLSVDVKIESVDSVFPPFTPPIHQIVGGDPLIQTIIPTYSPFAGTAFDPPYLSNTWHFEIPMDIDCGSNNFTHIELKVDLKFNFGNLNCVAVGSKVIYANIDNNIPQNLLLSPLTFQLEYQNPETPNLC